MFLGCTCVHYTTGIASFPGHSHFQYVFDRLQYAKMEGEELGDLVMCMMSGGQRVDRWGAQCAIVVTHKLCDDQSQIYQTMRCIDSLSNNTVSSSWTQYCKKDLEILH